MRKPKGIDGSELYVLDIDNEMIYEVDDWDDAVDKCATIADEAETRTVIVKVIASADYVPAHCTVVPE